MFCFSAFFTDRVFLNFSLLIKWETEDITQYAPIIVHYVLFTSWLLYKLSKCLLCVCVLVLLHYYKLTVCLSWFKVWLKIIYWILNFIELRLKYLSLSISCSVNLEQIFKHAYFKYVTSRIFFNIGFWKSSIRDQIGLVYVICRSHKI